MTTFRIRAHAKINLSLRAGEVRPDGYHALTTVFQSLALHDTLTVTRRKGAFVVTCTDPAVPADERNLVWKAARLVWVALGRRGEPRDLAIAIDKHVPMQAGLGGGSSDAAAAILACHQVWAGRRRDIDLKAVAARVGADVPYFLTGGTALGLARGDDMFPLQEIRPFWVVLAMPPFGVSTAEAFGWLDADRAAGTGGSAETVAIDVWPGQSLGVVNDLEPPVVRRHPAIGAVRQALVRAGAAAAAMTGSGSAVFGLFEDKARAERAARAAAGTGTVVILTRTVDRRNCMRR
jgi:4-diphosphocytidyl-2-C-methyl-D-erythritol kinase